MLAEELYRRRRRGHEIRLISVQSAKGGVGKTLLSFLLANHIRLHGVNGERARVVVFDLDFAGTSIVELLPIGSDSSDNDGRVWLHEIPLQIVVHDKKAVTLLDLFKQHLSGKNLTRTFVSDAVQGVWLHDWRR